MTINNVKEDNTVDKLRRFKDTHNKKIKTDNDNNNKQSEKASWWINELASLGIKKSNYNKTESNYLQNPEDLSADIK